MNRCELRSGWQCGLLIAFAFCSMLLLAPLSLAQQVKNSCLDCHSQLDPPLHASPDEYNASIHTQKGVTCVTCHGGDATTDDVDKSMGAAAGFKGHLDRKQIPGF